MGARDELYGHDPGPRHSQPELFSLYEEEPGGTRLDWLFEVAGTGPAAHRGTDRRQHRHPEQELFEKVQIQMGLEKQEQVHFEQIKKHENNLKQSYTTLEELQSRLEAVRDEGFGVGDEGARGASNTGPSAGPSGTPTGRLSTLKKRPRRLISILEEEEADECQTVLPNQRKSPHEIETDAFFRRQ